MLKVDQEVQKTEERFGMQDQETQVRSQHELPDPKKKDKNNSSGKSFDLNDDLLFLRIVTVGRLFCRLDKTRPK